MANMHTPGPVNPFAAKPWACLGVAATGTFMATLDGGIVNVALPTIAAEFGADLPFAQWAITIYLLTIACLLPAFGRLGDMSGRRNKYALGFFIFTVASLCCGAAASMWWVIAGRGLQAVGAALLMANGPAIVVMSFPGPQRGRALGVIGMVVSLGSLVGPSLGGFLVGWLGWPSIFFVNLPVGLAGLWLVYTVLPNDKRSGQGSFDLPGAVLYAVAIIFLLTAITHGGRWGWGSPGILTCLTVFVAGLWFFLRRQARVAYPLVDLSLFRIRSLVMGNLASLLAFMSLMANAVMMPFFLTRVAGLEPGTVGSVMAVMPLVMTVAAPVSGYFSEKVSHALLTGLGLGITACALYSQTLLTADASLTRMALGQAAMGLGLGVFLSPNNNAVLGSAPREKSGVAGSIMALVRNLGLVGGIASATAVFEAWRSTAFLHGADDLTAFTSGFRASLAFAACLALAGALCSITRGRRVEPRA